MIEIRNMYDDFFTIGKIAVLQKNTQKDKYDFDFRNNFECKSVVSEVDAPVLLHIGAVEDYAMVESTINDLGMKLLVPEIEHLRCSTIEQWYPALREKTPFTKVYDKFPDLEEVLEDFAFPLFIKGNRQTNRHRKSQCIIENAEQYEALRKEWKKDHILSWQKVAIREYVPLQVIDAEAFPDMVPISYEFRFFYFEGKCMGYGPYWNMGRQYSMSEDDLVEVLELTDWAAGRIHAVFPAIDVAKTAAGEWIIIEVNDAQESGFVGINPLELWNNTINAMQERTWLPVEEFFPVGTVIMTRDPLPDISVQEMWNIANEIDSVQKLVFLYAVVENKFAWISDAVYDYEEGTEDYIKACEISDAWQELADHLEEKVISQAKEEGLFAQRQPNSGLIKQLEPFMKKYGYRNGYGWWVPSTEKDCLGRTVE